jgi:CheY-like chemotaxis protein
MINELVGGRVTDGKLSAERMQRRALVLEDNEDARELLRIFLQNLGFAVVATSGGLEGFKAFQRALPDVIIADLAMPEGDGFDFIARVRSMPADRGGKVPAIALSAFSGRTVVDLALRAGFDRFVAKPVDVDKLARTIEELLR